MRRAVWRIYLVCLCVLATTLAASSQLAPAPPSDPTPVPPSCNIPRSGVATASIVQATGDSLQRKHWQPQGGVIQFTVKSFAAIPNDASFFVCY
jgi:hypothetical protein